MPQGLPYSGVPEVQTQVNPVQGESLSMSPDAFGANVGRAISDIGRQETDLALQMLHQQNETQVNDAANAASQELGKVEAEYRQLHGNDAVTRLPEYQQRVTEVGERIRKGLGDRPALQTAFAQRFGTYAASTNNSFGLWAANQGDDAYIKSLQSGVEQASSRLVRTAGLGGAEPHYDELIENVARLGQKLGWDKTTTDTYLQKQTGDVVQNLVQARIANGQFEEAKQVFDEAVERNVPGTDVPFLDADHQATIARHIQTETKAALSLSRAEYAQDAQDLMQSDIASRAATGIPVVTPGSEAEATMRAGMTPRQWDAYQSRAEKADMLFRATGDMRTQTNGEIAGALETMKPKGGEEDFASRQAVYTEAVRIAQDQLKLRNTDPGRAVQEGFAPVREAWAAYQQVRTPETLQAALKVSQSAQTAIGIEAPRQRLMPDALARDVAAQITGAAPGASYEALQAKAQAFGTFWPNAIRQMGKLLPPAYLTAAIMPNAQSAALMIETSRQDQAKLRHAIGLPDSGDQSLAHMIGQDPRMMDLRQSLAQRSGGIGTGQAVQAATESLALGIMATHGYGPGRASEAVEEAISRTVTDKYQTGKVNDMPFRVPANKPLDPIQDGAVSLQQNLKGEDLDIPPGFAPPGMAPSDIRSQWLASVRSTGYWVTNDDATGLILYNDAPGRGFAPVTSGGKPIERTWDQLQGQGIQAPPQRMWKPDTMGPFGALEQPLPGPASATGQGGPRYEVVTAPGGWSGHSAATIDTRGFPADIRTHIASLRGDQKAIVAYLNQVDPAGRLRGVTKVAADTAMGAPSGNTDYAPGEMEAFARELEEAAHPERRPDAKIISAQPGGEDLTEPGQTDAQKAEGRASETAAELDRRFPAKPGQVSFSELEQRRLNNRNLSNAQNNAIVRQFSDIKGQHDVEIKIAELSSRAWQVSPAARHEIIKILDKHWDRATLAQKVEITKLRLLDLYGETAADVSDTVQAMLNPDHPAAAETQRAGR